MFHGNGLGRRLGCVAFSDESGNRQRPQVQTVDPQRRKPFNLVQDSVVRLMVMLRALVPVRAPARRERTAISVVAVNPRRPCTRCALATNGRGPLDFRSLRTLLAD